MAKRAPVDKSKLTDKQPEVPDAPGGAPAAAAEQPATDTAPITAWDDLVDCARAKDEKFASQGVKEDDTTYFKRLISVVADVDDATFESLSDSAKAWYNESGAALNDGKPLPPLEGFVSKFGVKAEKAPAGEKPKREPPPPRGPGKTTIVRELVCMHPEWTLEQLEAELKAKGADILKSTASTIRSDVHATINAAKKMGRWNEKAAA